MHILAIQPKIVWIACFRWYLSEIGSSEMKSLYSAAWKSGLMFGLVFISHWYYLGVSAEPKWTLQLWFEPLLDIPYGNNSSPLYSLQIPFLVIQIPFLVILLDLRKSSAIGLSRWKVFILKTVVALEVIGHPTPSGLWPLLCWAYFK